MPRLSRLGPAFLPCLFGVWIGAVSSLAGCESTPPVPDSSVRAGFGQMQVVATATPPHAGLDTFARGTGAGARKGAAAGATVGVLGAAVFLSPVPGAPALSVAATTLAATLLDLHGFRVGAIPGAAAAVPVDLAERIDATLAKALADARLSEQLTTALHRVATDHPQARDHGLDQPLAAGDSVLELTITEVGLAGEGQDPPLRLYLTARVRVLDRAGEPTLVRDFWHGSAPHPWAAWSAGDATLIATELGAALDGMAVRVLDELFLITRSPFPSGLWTLPDTPEIGTCWLMPLDPPYAINGPLPTLNIAKAFGDVFKEMAKPQVPMAQRMRDMVRYTPVASLSPTLRWEPFPRPRDRTPANAATVARISAVEYDLRLWRAEDGFPTRLIYARDGLPAPEHTLEQPLEPDADYYWSFRARYRMDGAPQATRWAFSLFPAPPGGMDGRGGYCELDAIPPTNYYRFTTRR